MKANSIAAIPNGGCPVREVSNDRLPQKSAQSESEAAPRLPVVSFLFPVDEDRPARMTTKIIKPHEY